MGDKWNNLARAARDFVFLLDNAGNADDVAEAEHELLRALQARERENWKARATELAKEVERLKEENDCLCRKTYCAYCAEEFPLDTVTAEQVGEHIRTCPKHPMRKAEAERDSMRPVVDAAVAWVSTHKKRTDVLNNAVITKTEPGRIVRRDLDLACNVADNTLIAAVRAFLDRKPDGG